LVSPGTVIVIEAVSIDVVSETCKAKVIGDVDTASCLSAVVTDISAGVETPEDVGKALTKKENTLFLFAD
jgi:hypothetical protein